jgi:hypothetical protein
MQHTTTLGGITIVSKSLCFGDNSDMLRKFAHNLRAIAPPVRRPTAGAAPLLMAGIKKMNG